MTTGGSGHGPTRDAERGFTLVELLVYVALFLLVLGGVGAIMITALDNESAVRAAAQSTTSGQLAARSLRAGVANASAARLSTSVAGSQLLTVRTLGADADPAWACEAWFYSGADGALYTTRTSPASAIPAPTTTSPAWTLLATGVHGTGPGALPFSGTGASITVSFTVDAGSGPGSLVQTSIGMRDQGAETAPCF